MDFTAQELKKLSEEYFSAATDDSLRNDCAKANIDFYNTIKARIFSDYTTSFTYFEDESVDRPTFLPPVSHRVGKELNSDFDFGNFLFADDFLYSLAA